MAMAHAPTVLGSNNPVRFNPCAFDVDSSIGHGLNNDKTIQHDKESIVYSVRSKIENLKLWLKNTG